MPRLSSVLDQREQKNRKTATGPSEKNRKATAAQVGVVADVNLEELCTSTRTGDNQDCSQA
jgi:hypothetical protein